MDRAKQRAFVKAVDADPGSLAKLVFADYLEEQGDWDAGQGLRWCVKHGKWPQWNSHFGHWTWYIEGVDVSISRSKRRMSPVHCWLPKVVGVEMLMRHADYALTWLVAVRRVGWALNRIRQLVN